MGPVIAESAVQRHRFGWMLGILITTVVVPLWWKAAQVCKDCHVRPRVQHHQPLKRLGHCHEGRWINAPRQ